MKNNITLLPIIGRGVVNSQEDVYTIYEDLFSSIIEKYSELKPSEIDLYTRARNIFRCVGIDPTKTRPSSESLIRRVLSKKELWSVNKIVDLGNVCSIETGLPVGIYDIKKIAGNTIYIRQGKNGEEYEGIGRGDINLAKKPIFCDKKGPFGSPVSDSTRTSVHTKTKDFLFLFVAPREITKKEIMTLGLIASRRFAEHCGGSIEILNMVK